jgi:pimeloyl-ACP methyl ester carboxylesterase
MPMGTGRARMTGRHGFAVSLALVLVACTSGPTGRFTVNRHELAARCDGGPGPTVVFEAAVGGDHSLWPIAERIYDKAVACVYDRAGQGDSSVPDAPMTAETDVADLHALLATAGIPRPIIVVGHSYGAQIAWVELAEHPGEVAGVLLIDATPPSGSNLLESVLNDKQRKQFHDAFVGLRNVDFLTSLDQAQTDYGVQPTAFVTIITASHSMRPWCDVKLPCEEMQKEALATADEFVADHPSTRAVIAETSHFVQVDDPDLVVREILRLIDLVSKAD